MQTFAPKTGSAHRKNACSVLCRVRSGRRPTPHFSLFQRTWVPWPTPVSEPCAAFFVIHTACSTRFSARTVCIDSRGLRIVRLRPESDRASHPHRPNERARRHRARVAGAVGASRRRIRQRKSTGWPTRATPAYSIWSTDSATASSCAPGICARCASCARGATTSPSICRACSSRPPPRGCRARGASSDSRRGVLRETERRVVLHRDARLCRRPRTSSRRTCPCCRSSA